MVTMTDDQRAVLAHVVTDPDGWLAHAVDALGEDAAQSALEAKVSRWQADYLAALADEGGAYRPRAEREN